MVAPALAVTGITANNTIGIFESLPEYIDDRRAAPAERDRRQERRRHRASTSPTVFDQNREEVSLDQMSDNLKNAAIAGEDRRFYEHGGVDVPSVVRAAVGQATGNERSGGASTLTMQLVRNIRVQEAFNETTDRWHAGHRQAATQGRHPRRDLPRPRVASSRR